MRLRSEPDILSSVGLFDGVSPDSLDTLLACLEAERRAYGRGEFPLLAGDRPERMGIVLSGRLSVTKEDAAGNRTLVADIGPAGLFAEALCCAGVAESPVSVMAETDSVVLLLRCERFLGTCPKACGFHRRLIANLLSLIARKNLFLQRRMELISLKTIREKVLFYLKPFAAGRGASFRIPLNREEMADYLCVERSALSHELMKMKREGMIDYRRNSFTLR